MCDITITYNQVKVVTRKEIGKNITNSQNVKLFSPKYWTQENDLQNKKITCLNRKINLTITK